MLWRSSARRLDKLMTLFKKKNPAARNLYCVVRSGIRFASPK